MYIGICVHLIAQMTMAIASENQIRTDWSPMLSGHDGVAIVELYPDFNFEIW